jgi:hypothetical protein
MSGYADLIANKKERGAPRMTVCDGPFLLTGFLKGVFWISA